MYAVLVFQSLDICWLVRYFRKTQLTLQLCLSPLIIYSHSQHRTPLPSYTEHNLYSSHFCFPHWMLIYRRVAHLTDLFYCWPPSVIFLCIWHLLIYAFKVSSFRCISVMFSFDFMTIFNVHNSYLWIHYGRWSRL